MLGLLLQKNIAGVGLVRSLIYWPSMISPIIIGIAWKWIFGYDTGIANYLFSLLGLGKIPWLISNEIAFVSVIFVSVWAQVGFYMVIFIGGLNNIPDSYYEAAQMDGANAWKRFKLITLPLLKPTTLLVLVLSTINAFKVYQQVTVLTAGGPGRATVFLVQNIYEEAFKKPNGVGYASAQSFIFFLIMLLLSILQLKLSKEE
jgi:alpha-1,4-digalacturonate transport system permease protein